MSKSYEATFKFDNEPWLALQEYYKLPWHKRLFKKPPTPKAKS